MSCDPYASVPGCTDVNRTNYDPNMPQQTMVHVPTQTVMVLF